MVVDGEHAFIAHPNLFLFCFLKLTVSSLAVHISISVSQIGSVASHGWSGWWKFATNSLDSRSGRGGGCCCWLHAMLDFLGTKTIGNI